MYKPAAVTVGARALGPLAAVPIDQFGDAGGLRRPDALPADRRIQQAARRQRRIANQLRRQAAAESGARSAYSPDRAPSIRSRPSSSAGTPPTSRSAGASASCSSRVRELRCQPVEQFRMRRLLALRAEIFRCPHQAAPEELLPHAIHSDARRQRILGSGQPLRADDSRSFGLDCRQNGRHAGLDLRTLGPVIAAERDVRFRRGLV